LRGSKHRFDDGKNQQIGYSPVKIDSHSALLCVRTQDGRLCTS
jgi:hypothetical protein